MVIYKDSKSAVIKQKNDRAIYLYNNVAKLKEGYSYNLRVSQIKEFFGLKEIKKFKILEKNKKIPDYKKLYLEGKDIDVLDLKYQNES